jgi:predicted RNase H-related nuclease YkuK (DUF458 family)
MGSATKKVFKKIFKKKIDMKELNQYLSSCMEGTKIYMGCDSRVFFKKGERLINFTSVIVVHVGGKHGGKLFYEHDIEKDYSVSRKKPNPRLMREVQLVADLYLRMLDDAEHCLDKDIEIHLDINPDKDALSSMVVNEAVGYIRGMCQMEPLIKPEAWAASCVADYF